MYTYRQIPNNKWREKLKKILLTDKPLFFVRIDTTGLDAEKNALIGISILKCEWESGSLVKTGTYDSLIHSNAFITPFITNLTGITHAKLASAPSIDDVMSEVKTFLGRDAYVLAFNTQFLGSFLKKYDLPIALTLDMNVMGQALCEGHSGYKWFINEFGVKSPAKIFEHLIKRCPMGTIKYKKQPEKVSSLVSFNGNDIVIEDEDIFNEIDPDYLWEVFTR